MKGNLYMAVTPDEYELPMFVTDTILEMAKHYGLTKNAMTQTIRNNNPGKRRGVKFIKVKIEE